jgi:hypothetical protein
VCSSILDTDRHGKSQVAPLLHSHTLHFTQWRALSTWWFHTSRAEQSLRSSSNHLRSCNCMHTTCCLFLWCFTVISTQMDLSMKQVLVVYIYGQVSKVTCTEPVTSLVSFYAQVLLSCITLYFMPLHIKIEWLEHAIFFLNTEYSYLSFTDLTFNIYWDSIVPLNVHPFHPKWTTLSQSGHLNWIVVRPQQNLAFKGPYTKG